MKKEYTITKEQMRPFMEVDFFLKQTGILPCAVSSIEKILELNFKEFGGFVDGAGKSHLIKAKEKLENESWKHQNSKKIKVFIQMLDFRIQEYFNYSGFIKAASKIL